MPYNDKMPTDKMPMGIKCPAVTKYLYRQNVYGDKMPSSDKITLWTKCPQNILEDILPLMTKYFWGHCIAHDIHKKNLNENSLQLTFFQFLKK